MITPVPGLNWFIHIAAEVESARLDLRNRIRATVWMTLFAVFIVVIAMVAFLIVIIGLVVAAYYTTQLLKETPYFFFTVQRYSYLIEIRVKTYSNAAVEPFLRLHSFIAGARAIRKK